MSKKKKPVNAPPIDKPQANLCPDCHVQTKPTVHTNIFYCVSCGQVWCTGELKRAEGSNDS